MNVSLHPVDWAIVSGYLLLMLGIGVLLASRIHQFKDYFLAGGMLTTPLLVCTLVSTYYELDVTFATSESGFYYGVVSWVWLSRPYYVAIFIAALLLARRLKRYAFMTLPDLLEHQYGTGTRVVGALACFVYSLPITALAGMAVMFETLGWSKEVGILVAVGICVAYTMMGGLWADAISDTVQFVLMCVSLAVAIPIAMQWIGGFNFVTSLPAAHLTSTGGLSPWLIVAWTTGALTVFVEPAFYQRIFAAKDNRSIVQALLIGVLLWAAYDWGVTLIGMVARAAVDMRLLPEALEGKQALLTVCLKTLPLGLRGLFIGGVLAAAMSSVDSYCLLASGNLVYDIYRPLSQRGLSDSTMLRSTRVGTFVVMLVAVVASLAFERILDAWVFLASVLVSVVFVPVMGALFTQVHGAAGLSASIAGFVGLLAFYGVVYLFGVYDQDNGSYVWRWGDIELWREYAVLVALPISLVGFVVGARLRSRVWPSPPGSVS